MSKNFSTKILCTSISLSLFLVLVRAKLIGYTLKSLVLSFFFPFAALAGYHDILFVAITTFLFLILLVLVRKNKKAQRNIYRTFVGIALLTLLICLSNIEMVKMLGTPFNYQWLYYSDFLGSRDAINAFWAGMSLKLSAKVISICLALVGVAWVAEQAIKYLNKYRLERFLLLFYMASLAIYLPVANYYITKKQFSYAKIANPVTAFVHSTYTALVSAPELFTMSLPEALQQVPRQLSPVTDTTLNSTFSEGHSSKVRNVLFFVLESVPAEHVKNPDITPTIHAYKPISLSFDNIYAHSPSTHNSMAAMLSSMYPWISFKSITAEHPDINVPTLSSELKKQNYRTAFIHTSDNRFQRMDEFLAKRQFDKVDDWSSLNCDKKIYKAIEEYGPHLDGIDDECLIDAFTNWVDSDTTKPFFAMLWTMQTHFPYFLTEAEKKYGVKDKYLNRYLNALHHSDAVLGELLTQLKKRGLDQSTLVVLVGDHGEAFARHDQYGHGRAIYEENVHVPLILINPTLFNGQTKATIGGHIDVAPTILNVLGLPAPEEWQGRSLFSNNRINKAYFFAPWTDFKFGYREGNYKFIYNASNNQTEIYDLSKDPLETQNLADQMPDFVLSSHQNLAAWIQYHNTYFKNAVLKK